MAVQVDVSCEWQPCVKFAYKKIWVFKSFRTFFVSPVKFTKSDLHVA